MTPHRAAAVATALLLCTASGAEAAIPSSLYTLSPTPGTAGTGCVVRTDGDLDYVFCNDGTPAFGGTTANTACVTADNAACKAITVPAEYAGDGFTGLPLRKTPTTVPGADADGNVALDVDISWPASPPPANGYPMLFFMHGCCGGTKGSWEAGDFQGAAPNAIGTGGEQWHYNNAWFASRGYVVVTFTARGFATLPNPPTQLNRMGSTGETQLDSRKFEINDFQSLACQIYASRSQWSAVTGQTVEINPQAIIVTGGSYGGGFSWMALTDPLWTCNADSGAAGVPMKLAAAAPKYGWTDLVYSLAPTGRHSTSPANRPKTDGCDSGSKMPDGTDCADPVPAGVPKQTINAGLYGTGTAGSGPGSNATTFPQKVHEAQACLTGAYPVEGNPACAGTLATTLPEFLADRSAYYQQQWFDKIVSDPAYRVPIFSAATLTDPLFPPHEHRRMHNRILALVPGYPLQAYFGDFQHFVQNKAKEWGDLCGADRHVCVDADFAGNFNASPSTLARLGITTRLNRFIDYYARPSANALQAAPQFDVTAALQVCPQKGATAEADLEPGETFTASTFEALAGQFVVFDSGGSGPNLTVAATGATTTSGAGGGSHADPVATSSTAGSTPNHHCSTRLASDPAPAGVAQYTSPALVADVIMLGSGTVALTFTGSGDTGSRQINARLYEVLPDGSAVLADRGFRRLSAAEAALPGISFELFGNGWKFSQGNRIRIEIAQDDSPYLKASNPPSGMTLSRVAVTLPRRSGASVGGGGDGSYGGGGGGALALVVLVGLLAAVGLRRGG